MDIADEFFILQTIDPNIDDKRPFFSAIHRAQTQEFQSQPQPHQLERHDLLNFRFCCGKS